MNHLNIILPKDLVNIVEEYAKDRTNYNRMLEEYKKEHWRSIVYYHDDEYVKQSWRPLIYQTLKERYSDEYLITNAYLRGSTITHVKQTNEQLKFNDVVNELIDIWNISIPQDSLKDLANCDVIKRLIYYIKHKDDEDIKSSSSRYYEYKNSCNIYCDMNKFKKRVPWKGRPVVSNFGYIHLL